MTTNRPGGDRGGVDPPAVPIAGDPSHATYRLAASPETLHRRAYPTRDCAFVLGTREVAARRCPLRMARGQLGAHGERLRGASTDFGDSLEMHLRPLIGAALPAGDVRIRIHDQRSSLRRPLSVSSATA
jgi:hypothetical protein